MSNKDYRTIRVTNDSYEKLRELKFKKNMSFVDILKECIDEAYMNLKEEEKDKEERGDQ